MKAHLTAREANRILKVMTEPSHESFLPRVDDTDLAQVLFDDITDPTHKKRWDHFRETNPTLARELLARAYLAAHESDTPVDLTRKIINSITFAVSALEMAARRQETDKPIVDGDGEALQPSA